MVFKAFRDLVRDDNPVSVNPRQGSRYPAITTSPSPTPTPSRRGGGGMALLDPSVAIKASGDMFSRNALEFISGGTNSSVPYSEQQLLGAYLTSVYLFAALRRVSNLISRVKVVGEALQDGKWVRLPDDHRLNQLFTRDGSETMSRIWLNHAVYGASAIYKVKTRRAMLEQEQNRAIYDFKDGAVSGLYVLDKPMWDLDEDTTYGKINGLYVNQYDSGDNLIGSRNYIERPEFVYITDWNPNEPNRGMPLAAVCIHEAVANASIAQWISEYFTRGAMPFIMVSMAEDDPALMTDADLRKYKRQFEDYWSGIGSSLRSVFFDRAINVEQVGIPADEVAAPDLNETALEGIAATIGLDRELIVTPSGGSQERHALLIKRAWEDTVIPLAEKYVSGFNRDLGLPEGMRLVVDVSNIAELEADRENKADTEISIYDSQLQSYNETRTRLQMAPIEELDNHFNLDGRPVHLDKILETSKIPSEQMLDYAMQLWDANLARRSQVLELLNRDIPNDMPDGYKYEIEERVDLVTSMWGDDLLTRAQVLENLGFQQPDGFDSSEDGYRSELERGADYGEWVTQLWDDNLLTRSQVLQMLDLDLVLPDGVPDGYADEIGDRKSNVMDMWGDNLLTRRQTLERLGVEFHENMIDGYVDEIDIKLDRAREAETDYVERIMDYWGDNLLTRGSAMDMLKLPMPDNMIDGFQSEVDARTDQHFEETDNTRSFYTDLWGENLVTRSSVAETLGIPMPDGAVDGYADEVEALTEAMTDQQITEMQAAFEAKQAALEPSSELENKSTGTIYRKPVDRNDSDDDNGGPDQPPPSPPRSPQPDPSAPSDPDMDFDVERLDDSQFWQNMMDEYSLHVMADDIDSDDALAASEEDWLESGEDDALSAAEEDWLEGGQEIGGTVMEPYWDDMVDILPDEALPHADADIYEEDGVVDYDPYWDESEADVRGSEDTRDGDYYGAYSAPNATPVPPPPDDDAYLSDDDFSESFDNILNPPVVPMDDIWDEIIGEVEDDFDEAVDVIQDSSELAISSVQTDRPRDLYVSLWIDADERVSELQDELMEVLDDVEWQEPETFHITLAYAPNATDQDMENVRGILPESVPDMLIEVEALDTFDNPDQTVIKLRVKRTDALDQLQAKIAMAFNSFGIEMSPYSDPSEYKPHITLGIAPPNTEIPDTDAQMLLKPITVFMGRDGYDMVEELPIGDVKNILAFSEDNHDVIPEQWVDDAGKRWQDIEGIGSVQLDYGTARPYPDEDGNPIIEYSRDEMVDIVKSWYEGYKLVNDSLKRNDPVPDVDEHPNLADLLPKIYKQMMEFIIQDQVTDRVIVATLKAIDSGVFDKGMTFDENPIKWQLSNMKAAQVDAQEEINVWQKTTAKKGLKKALKFETHHISDDLTNQIKSELSELSVLDKEGVSKVFEKARYALNNES